MSIATPQRSRPVAVAIDLRGNDVYRQPSVFPAFGAGEFGIGLMYELGGDDSYTPTSAAGSAGSGGIGVGVFRDVAGNDWHFGWDSLGYTNSVVGYYRDDGGDDYYRAYASSGGYSENGGLAVMWDRAGADQYVSTSGSTWLWGYDRSGGRAWFVDESAFNDEWYALTSGAPHPWACNNCTWRAGATDGGRGNDNSGGLAHIITYETG